MPRWLWWSLLCSVAAFAATFIWAMYTFAPLAALPVSDVTLNATAPFAPHLLRSAPSMPAWILPAIYLATPLLHHLYVVLFPDYYYTAFYMLVDTPKYVTWAISAPPMLVHLAIVCGVVSRWALWGVACNMFWCIVMGFCGRVAYVHQYYTASRACMAASFLALTCAFIPIWESYNSLAEQLKEAGQVMPDFVNGIISAETICFYSFGIIAFGSEFFREQAPYRTSIFLETCNNFASKVSLCVLIAAGAVVMYTR
jgi:hypothetical protein